MRFNYRLKARQTCFAASDVTPVYGVTCNTESYLLQDRFDIMGNKTLSIASGLVLQQFVARFTVPLASLLKREFLELGNGLL